VSAIQTSGSQHPRQNQRAVERVTRATFGPKTILNSSLPLCRLIRPTAAESRMYSLRARVDASQWRW